VRAAPHACCSALAEQVAGVISADLEAGIPHPAGRQRVGGVLFGRVSEAGAPTDRIELLEPLEDARRLYSPNGLNGLELVETRTLFVSR
jgi:hypothetical protein